jgi:NAD-dependent dihydropyrimidine dehydrogenase PreA subunit
MARRKIIRIDEDLCNGCGECVTACAEGALQIIDGKARLVKEQFCDGFGDCIGECPTGALTIEEREADVFDIEATRAHVAETRGADGVAELDTAEQRHPAPPPGGCPGMRAQMLAEESPPSASVSNDGLPAKINPSELRQWPVQIHLVQPGAEYFKNKELALLSTCAPIASADVHWRFIRGRAVLVGCPKLDRTEPYAAKLGEILKERSIPKLIAVLMEVPCCGGLGRIAHEAIALSGRDDLIYEEVIVGLQGEIKEIRQER